jgi:hypothetical protein
MVGLWPTVPSKSRPVRRGRKETSATTMISAGEVEVKWPIRCERASDQSSHEAGEEAGSLLPLSSGPTQVGTRPRLWFRAEVGSEGEVTLNVVV